MKGFVAFKTWYLTQSSSEECHTMHEGKKYYPVEALDPCQSSKVEIYKLWLDLTGQGVLTILIIFYCLTLYHQNNKYLVGPNTYYEYDSAFPLNKFFSAQIKEAFRCRSGESCFSDNNPQHTLPEFLTESYVVIFTGSVRKTIDCCTDPEASPTWLKRKFQELSSTQTHL